MIIIKVNKNALNLSIYLSIYRVAHFFLGNVDEFCKNVMKEENYLRKNCHD